MEDHEETFQNNFHYDEDLLEELYWDYDAQRQKRNIDERSIFKGKLRYFARKTLEQVLLNE